MLRALGRDEIAALPKGVPRHYFMCPIARALGVQYDTDILKFKTCDDAIRAAKALRKVRKDRYINAPGVFIKFARGFDTGTYPDLIDLDIWHYFFSKRKNS